MQSRKVFKKIIFNNKLSGHSRLNELNFNLIKYTLEFLQDEEILKLLTINTKFNRIIKNEELFKKFLEFIKIACKNNTHCNNYCKKSNRKNKYKHSQFCKKNYDGNLLNELSNPEILNKKTTKCASCKLNVCWKCTTKNFFKCAGPHSKFSNQIVYKENAGSYMKRFTHQNISRKCINNFYFPSICNKKYCEGCVKSLYRCDACSKYFCKGCTFIATCQRCKIRVCAKCNNTTEKFYESKGVITCGNCMTEIDN